MVEKVQICVLFDLLRWHNKGSKRDNAFSDSIDFCLEILNLDFAICSSIRLGFIKGESLPKRILFFPIKEMAASNMPGL